MISSVERTRRKPIWWLLTALTAAALACSTLSAGNLSNPSGQIVFQSNRDGNTELYALNLTTNVTTRLTNNSAEDLSPAYSAANQQIAFISDRDGTGFNIYTFSLDQLTPQALFPKDLIVDYPDWSPDGKLLAASLCTEVQKTDEKCLYDLFILDPQGPKFTRLAETRTASEWVPNWSPDGKKIAFASDRDGDSEVYVINVDGSGLVQLTENDGYDGRPRWSPDGTQIAFETDRDGDWDIFLMNADGSNVHPLTVNAKASDWMEAWSPDGKWLVYVSSQDENDELYLIRSDGTDQRRLTDDTYDNFAPIWIP